MPTNKESHGSEVDEQTIAKRKQTEAHCFDLFNAMTNMFAALDIIYFTMELTYDKSGKPVDGVFFEVNPATERLLGKSREQLIGKSRKELFGNFFDELPEKFYKVIKTGNPLHFEGYGGALKKYYDIYTWQVAENQVSVILRDITESKKAEEALKTLNEELAERFQQRTKQVTAERQRLYNVLETLPAYVILLDRDHYVPFANKVFRERFGESHGRRCHEYLFNRDDECLNCVTYNVYRENKPQHWYWTGPDGRDYDIYDFPFKEADGSTLILEMGIDITEQKRMEKQLKDSDRLAAIGATAGMVGHDIRNPLQAITSDVYLAKTELALTTETEEKKNALESLKEIEKNIDYINKIVADLQDYARPLNPVAKGTDLEALCQEVFLKINVPNNIKTSCKAEKEARLIMADPDLLKRVITNLVLNAIQAMPKGGRLSIYSFREEGGLVIEVQDTGVGITEEAKAKLFTPMFTTKSKGMGFGLAVVKRVIESMNGTVSFESEQGKGTKFIVRLPPKELKGKLTYK